MNWLSFLGSAVLLLSIQYDSVESISSISPWAEPARARSFMNCLSAQIAGSNVLPTQEKEDLSSIMDTLMSAVSKANARGKTNEAQLKAINMAFASSMAEIVAVEDVGNQANIVVKTQALSGALEQCFQLVMGTVDRKFINEINDLILMFAKEAVSEDAEGGFATDGSLSSSSIQTKSQSADNIHLSAGTLQGSIKIAGGHRRGYSGNQASQSSSSSLKTTSQASENAYRSEETIRGSTKMAGGYRRGYSGSQDSQTVLRHRPRISRPERIGVRSQVSEARSGLDTSSSLSTSSSQRADSTKTGAASTAVSHSRGHSVRPDTGILRGTVASVDNNLGRGQQAGLITRIADALANSSTMKVVLRRGVSQKTAYNLIRRTVQSLASTLGVDRNTLSRKALQAISKIAPGSDTSAYSQALSNVLVNCRILTERNIDSMGPRILSAVLNGLSSAGQSLGINVSNANVQKDIQLSRGFLATSSTTSFSHSEDSETNSVASTTRDNHGPHLVGSLGDTVSSTVDSINRESTQGGLISRVRNALENSDAFRSLFKRSVSPQTASNLIHRTLQSLANNFGIDGNNIGRVALQALSQLSSRSDTSSYAQVLSTALVTGGILDENNIESVGPQVLSAVLNALSSTGQSLGISVDSINVQNDIVASSGSQTTSSSSSFSQSDSSASTESASATGSYSGRYLDGTLGGPIASAVASTTRADLQAGLISRVTNALMNSSPFRVLLRRGVAPQTASNLIQRTVLSLADTFGADGNKFSGIASQALSQLSPRSDTSSYAQVLSTALVAGGILDENNIDSVGPQVMSAVLNVLSSTGQNLGINVDSTNVQNVIESSNDSQTTSSSSTRFSQSDSTASSEIAATTGGYSVGTSEGNVASTVDSSVGTSLQDGLISRITNALVNSSTFNALLRKDVAPQTASNLIQRSVQSLANTFGIAGNNFGRTALQGLSQLSSHSDTSSYAQLLSTALVTGGILDENNIDSVGPQVMSAVINALSSSGQNLGISVDSINAQSDIVSSSGYQTTSSSSSTSLSQSDRSVSTENVSTTGGHHGRHSSGTLRGPIAPVVDSSVRVDFKDALISRVTHALLNSSAFRGLSRKGTTPEIASNLIQRTVQSLANNFGADGNNFSRIALQALSHISSQSDIPSYAQVLSTALVNGGILDENNIDSVGPQVMTAVMNVLSSSGQSLGISVDSINSQNDIVSSSSSQTTSSSSTSFSQSDSSTSTENVSTTGGHHGRHLAGTLRGPIAQVVDSSVGADSKVGLISRVAHGLLNSSAFIGLSRKDVTPEIASNLIQKTVQSLANNFGADGNNFNRIALQALSHISPQSDIPSYAQVLSTALVNGGILNENNIDSVGPLVLNALSSAGQSIGFNLYSTNMQNDILSTSSSQETSSSSTSFSQSDDSTSTSAATTTGGYQVGNLGGLVSQNIDSSSIGGPHTRLISRVANALVKSPTFRAVLRRGVPAHTASNLILRTTHSLADTLGVDGNNLGRLAIKAMSQLSPHSDTPAYAQILATSLVAGGILNESNIDSVGPQVLSAFLRGMSSERQGLGINVGNVHVQSDILSASDVQRTSSTRGMSSERQGLGINVGNVHVQSDIQSASDVQRTTSSSNSFSHADDSTTYNAASTSGGISGRHPVGIVGGPVGPTVDLSGRSGPHAGLISRVANALVNSSTFRTLLRRGVQLQTASNMIQGTIQSLSDALGIDGSNLDKLTSEVFGQLSPDSDTPFYAQALSTALVTGGIVNESNIDDMGPQILSFILQGLSNMGQGLGLNIDTRNVENDVLSSIGFLGTSSSSSFSETEGETSTGLAMASGNTSGVESVVGGQDFDYSADQTALVQSSSSNQGFTSSAINQDISESSGFTSSATNQDFSESNVSTSSATNQDFKETSGIVSSGVEASLDKSVLRSLNSPIGLRSGAAEARISQLASSVLNSISPVGVDANILARSLHSSVSNLRRAGMSSNDAKIEVLMETIVGLLQLLSNAHVRGLNMSTASAVTSSAARSFELALAK